MMNEQFFYTTKIINALLPGLMLVHPISQDSPGLRVFFVYAQERGSWRVCYG